MDACRQTSFLAEPEPELEPVRAAAVISPCGLYRYSLHRAWSNGPRVNFIMLNPSTADAMTSDPTMRKCVSFAKAWGYGSLAITNLYAFRATSPKDLWKAADRIGPENDTHLEHEARTANRVVCAWGNGGAPVWRKDGWHRGRGWIMLRMLEDWDVMPHALRITGECMPEHPLYLPSHLIPKTWEEVPKPEALWRPSGFDPCAKENP